VVSETEESVQVSGMQEVRCAHTWEWK